MAQEACSSNTSRCSSRYGYHVSLSFSKDTRKTFADHLYTAFVNAGFRTFRDDNELERGQEIKPGLEKAIQQSRSCVIVFSKDYAFSEWCLDELVMILDRRKKSSIHGSDDHVVLPIFYDVDPSQVRRQTGSLEKAFATHQRNQSCNRVSRWRAALSEVADIAGMVLQNQADGHESKFIKKVVKVIEDKLSRTPLSVTQHMIGIHSRTETINLWLQDGSTDVGLLAIYGMRGIGKTTIAKYVYNSNFKRFEGSSFLENIREVSKQPNGLVQIQMHLLHDISHGRKVKIHSVSEGITKIQDTISSKRVLLVLDDVDHMDQLDAILRMQELFYPGSKIIVTTSCAGLLNIHKAIKVHNVETLGYFESLELFSWHAFGQGHPFADHMGHSDRIVHHSGGLPLALKVLGSSLSGKSLPVWESTLNKLEAIPNNEILKKMRISFDSLQDNHDRRLFLHIACFFIGMDTNVIHKILDDCGFYTIVGIQNLIDRCLVTIDKDKRVQMHHMIRDMGRGIVRLESEEAGERSRLWHHKDSFKVLTENTGTQTIEGLVLNMTMHTNPAVDTPSSSKELVVLETNAFARMHKLRLLQLDHVQLSGCYEEFPKGLRWLCWLDPSEHLPSNFPLERLVVLEICSSRLRQVCKGTKHLPSLKILNLSHSHALTETPDFSYIPNLEGLILKDCASLVDVHESIGNLERLMYWNMEDCISIRKLPKNICNLKFLETLIISGCSNLDELPIEMSKMESLQVFQADRVPIHRLLTTSEVISRPRKTPEVCWASYLPRNIVDLSLSNCNLSDGDFPRDFTQLSSLRRLDVSCNPIYSLPECISGVSRLDQLSFYSCTWLKSLVRLPRVAGTLILSSCPSLEKVSFQSVHLPDTIRIGSNWSLVEVGYRYKLELLENVDAEMINLLGLSNSKYSTETIQMATIYAANSPGHEMTSPSPILGLHQYGIFSTFLPGNDVPGQFNHKTAGSSISFTVPLLPNLMIRGLNIFAVYTESKNDSPDMINVNFRVFPYPIITEVTNKSKGMKWIYGPTFMGVPSDGQDVTWLSHWKFANELECGNEVTISLFTIPEVEVKECGVQLVYIQEEKMMSSQTNTTTTDPFYPSVIGGDLSSFEVRPGTYFLCRLPIGLTSKIDMDVRSLVCSNYLIRGSAEITDEEEGQQGDCTLAARRSSSDNDSGGRGRKVLNLIMATVFLLSLPLIARSSLLLRKKRHATRSP